MKIIKGLFSGLFKGLGIALGLYAIAFILELLNCLTCGISGCHGSCSIGYGGDSAGKSLICSGEPYAAGSLHGVVNVWNKEFILNSLLFCAIAGSIIGAIYGISKQMQESNRKRRIKLLILREKDETNKWEASGVDLAGSLNKPIYDEEVILQHIRTRSDIISDIRQAKEMLEKAENERKDHAPITDWRQKGIGDKLKYEDSCRVRWAKFEDELEDYDRDPTDYQERQLKLKQEEQKQKQDKHRKEQEEKYKQEKAQRIQWASQGLCRYCGSELDFSGNLYKCSSCGKMN